MAVIGATLAHVFIQSLYTYVTQGSSCLESIYTEVEDKEIPKNSVLRSMIILSSWNKKGSFFQQFLQLWKSFSRPKGLGLKAILQ